MHDISRQLQLYSGALPLSRGTTLTWLSFSSEGLLAAADSDGVIRLRNHDYGGCWVPVFTASAVRKNAELYWPVAVDLRQLMCVQCTATQPTPTVSYVWQQQRHCYCHVVTTSTSTSQ